MVAFTQKNSRLASLRKKSFIETLGYFSFGIPCVFIRSDIVLQSNKKFAIYNEYANEPRHFDNTIFEAINLVMTPFHEVRHFHDALLSPYLFELFLLYVQRTLIGGELIVALREVGINDFSKRTLHENLNKIKPNTANDWNMYLKLESRFCDLYDNYFQPVGKDGFSVAFLFEANAKLTEFILVKENIGEEAAIKYLFSWFENLPIEYNALFQFIKMTEMERDTNSILSALGFIHFIILYCLYLPGNPAKKFLELLKSFYGKTKKEINSEFEKYTPIMLKENVKSYLSDEQIPIIDIGGVFSSEELSPLGNQIRKTHLLPDDLLNVRKDLIAKYIDDMDFNITNYVRRLYELPLPPICFYPDDEALKMKQAPAVNRDELKDYFGDIYSICTFQNSGKQMVHAGIVPFPKNQPCFQLHKVDTLIAWSFLLSDLFDEDFKISAEMEKYYLYNWNELTSDNA